MSNYEQEKMSALQALDAALAIEDDDDQEVALNDVQSTFEELQKATPDDLEVIFNNTFSTTYSLSNKPVEAKEKGIQLFVEFVKKLCLKMNMDLTLSNEEKSRILADIATKSELLISNFIKKEMERSNSLFFLAGLAFQMNDNAKDWDVDEFDLLYKSGLDGLSEEGAKWALSGATALILALKQLETDNVYACINYVAQKQLERAINIPAFAYDSDFYDKFIAMIQSMTDVVKTSAPHELYFLPEAQYDGIALDVKKLLLPKYEQSELCKYIRETNDAAREEAYARYWETHEGEKEKLLEELQSLEQQIKIAENELQQSSAIISSAKKEREDSLIPIQKEVDEAEKEVVRLESILSKLGLFKGKQKKELRANIEEKTAAQLALMEKQELMQKEATKLFQEKTKDAVIAESKSEKAIRTIRKRIDEIKSKLNNPLQ